ncbi:single-stranded-DNA-specific exonuclease RecJ, partial [Catenibacillus scindens]
FYYGKQTRSKQSCGWIVIRKFKDPAVNRGRKEYAMREKWMIMAKRADFNQLGTMFHISPVLARLAVNRDIREPEQIRRYLYGGIEDLYDPLLMKDLEKAADRITQGIAGHEKMAIASDFDVDGIMSGFILKTGLSRIGADCEIYTPDRISEGYGLNRRIVEQSFERGARLLITCDNGIAAFEGVARAKELGMDVIVTDHHDIPFEEQPDGSVKILRVEADAIVNPKQPDCAYPFKKLCGAGVAFKLISRLYDRNHIPEEEKYALLEYVAIATVADVMDLQDENRIMVRLGLDMVRHTRNTGIRALIKANNLDFNRISAYHIGFVIGPCFNAAGRLDTVKIALDLLSESDAAKADMIAQNLKELNESRKGLTVQGFDQAVEIIENSDIKEDKVLLILLNDCHESLVGIIAGRVREKYHKPSIVFSRVEDGRIKGSGRSIEAYNMFVELSRQKHLLERFGGHPMAAGLTLKEENLEALRRNLNETATLTAEDFLPVVHIDMTMPIGYVTEKFIQELELLEPFGKGNPKPVFAQKHFRVLRARIIGKNRNVLKMLVMDEYRTCAEAIYFGDIEAFLAFVEESFGAGQRELMLSGKSNNVDLAFTYYPEINEYMGTKNIQIVITGYCRIGGR